MRDDFAERCLFGVIPNVWEPDKIALVHEKQSQRGSKNGSVFLLADCLLPAPAHGVGDIQQNGAFQACFRLETFDEEFAGARVEPQSIFAASSEGS